MKKQLKQSKELFKAHKRGITTIGAYARYIKQIKGVKND